MKDQYYKMPNGAMYLKCVYGTMFAVYPELVKDENGDWVIIKKEKELETFDKNE